MEEALKDERFSHILKDPRFRKIPKNVRKIKIDKRFKNMFSNKEFNEKCKLDERGRALNLTSSENLKKLYNVTSDSSEEDDLETEKQLKSKKSSKKNKNSKLDKHSSVSQDKLNQVIVDKVDSDKKAEEAEIEENELNISKKSSHFKKNNLQKNLNQCAKQFKKVKEKVIAASDKEESSSSGEEVKINSKSARSHHFVQNKSSGRIQEAYNETSKKLEEDNYKEIASSSDENESDISDENFQKSNSSNSEDSEDSDSDESSTVKDEDFDHHWEELHEEAPDTNDITKRLAVCNMDWDRIRAEDLFTVFHSFKPPDGSIHSVKIYPSEYGLKRMEEEKLKGPQELVEKTLDPDEEEDLEDKKGSRYNREKLRQYQINRLRYYYAVIVCDTAETANHLYDQLNGMEYESSSIRFDLRFIPDDTTFDQEPISVSEKIPDPTEYKPRLFVTSALQQVKVNLTWDETDPQRRETLQKAFTDPDSMEKNIKNYLASSSEESEEESDVNSDEENKISTKDRIAKYRELLQSLEEKEKKEDEKYEMEITWDTGLKEKTEKLVKEKLDDTSNPFEEMLKKRKEERKLKKQMKKASKNEKAERSSASEDSNLDSDDQSSKQTKEDTKKIDELYLISDSKKVNNSQEKKSKWKKKKKVKEEKINDFKCDVLDPRFSAIYSSHEYNIDPSDPHFKSTEGTLAIIQEKQKRLKNRDMSSISEDRKAKKMKYV